MPGFRFTGTRGGPKTAMFSAAILAPDASYGGIYVPEQIPMLKMKFLEDKLNCSYKDLAFNILQTFGMDIGNNAIFESLRSYEKFDDPKNPVPVVNVTKNLYVVELWHGPTRAFKDMALQPFPALVSMLAKMKDINYLVLAATSGDTGPAALDGFRDKPNVKIVCLYPDGGTSDVQKQQMVTEYGKNAKVIGIKGNFDDAQSALKKMLASETFKAELNKKDYQLSAANSVNFGRIIFQIVYHFWSYYDLVRQGHIKLGDEITSIIPSGNFGNGLAAYYAKKMGLPIKKIVLASNANNVLTDFIKTGMYDLRNRKLVNTSSPAMDILKSSNIERLLFHICGPERTNQLMVNLEEEKYLQLAYSEHLKIQQIFDAGFASDDEVAASMKKTFDSYGYISDPHTATAFVVRDKLEIDGVTIIASTAEWTKFSETMSEVHGCQNSLQDLSFYLEVDIPPQISKLEKMPVIHTDVIDIEDIESAVLEFV